MKSADRIEANRICESHRGLFWGSVSQSLKNFHADEFLKDFLWLPRVFNTAQRIFRLENEIQQYNHDYRNAQQPHNYSRHVHLLFQH